MKLATYETTDILLAACLIINNYTLENIKLNGNKGTFCFLDVEDEIIEKFDLGKLRVEPTIFNNAIKRLTTSVRRMCR